MDKYHVLLTDQAVNDLDAIYSYIANNLFASTTAENIVNSIESVIINLEDFPHRGAIRMVGNFKNKGYRQVFVDNYIIVYRIEEDEKRVIVLTIQNMRQNF